MHMYILYMLLKHTHTYICILYIICMYVCMYVCILVTVICRFMCMYMYMYACTCVHVTHAEKDTSSNTCLEEAHELATWDPPVLLHSETLEDCRAERGRRRERERDREKTNLQSIFRGIHDQLRRLACLCECENRIRMCMTYAYES